MKLRSDTFKNEAPPPRPIPQTHPVTEKITASNLSSRLVQLPQELKNQIYTYLLGGNCIHVEEPRYKSTKRPYLLYPCCVKATSSSGPRALDARTDATLENETDDATNDSVDDETSDDINSDTDDRTDAPSSGCNDPHRKCYMSINGGYDFYRPFLRKRMNIPLNLLRTCRQVYHEAKHVIYTTNTLSFQDSTLLTKFISHLDALPSGQKTLAIRHLHLHLTIRNMSQANAWNRAFCGATRRLTNLRSVDISIDQAVWKPIDHRFAHRRKNPSMFKIDTFLVGMLGFRKLKWLREMTLMVTDLHPWGALNTLSRNEEMQKWAQDMRAKILGGGKELRMF